MKQQKRVQPTKKNEVLSYSVEVRDKEGRVLRRISAPSKSYVQQWNQVINIQAKGTASTLTVTDGSTASIGIASNNLSLAAGIGAATYGIRVGKGTTAVAIDDFALETPLEQGAGLDQFAHQAETFTVPAVVGPTCSFTTSRIMINNSGAIITGIREIGAYMIMEAKKGLGFRDVLPGAVTVPDGGSITVTYTIAVTV